MRSTDDSGSVCGVLGISLNGVSKLESVVTSGVSCLERAHSTEIYDFRRGMG